MEASTHYASFLVRLWHKDKPGLPEDTDDWQGEVEHIQSSRRWTFDTLNELLSVLRRQAAGPASVGEGDEGQPRGIRQ